MDLTEFVRARLDEDEAAAKRASRDKLNGDSWHAGDGGDGWTQPGTPVLGSDGRGTAVAIGDYAAAHIAFHDPARVLREVAAKRARLAFMVEATANMDRLLDDETADAVAQAEAAERTWTATVAVKHDAAIWSDHPDFVSVWASGGAEPE